MEIEITEAFPSIISAPSRLFSHPSRVADAWAPSIETVLLGETAVPEHVFTVRVFEGSTASLGIKHWTRNPVRRYRRIRTEPIALDGLIFDARWETAGNVTHTLIYPMTFVLLAQRLLREHGGMCDPVTMLLAPGTPQFILTMLELMSIRAMVTDKEARGRILHVAAKASSGGERQHFPIPELFASDFPGYVADTPKHVFLSRKCSRTINNEAEVEALLSPQGFVKVYFEDLPMATQWSIMRNAEEIVGVHGAALGQLLFHNGHATWRGPRLVEVFGAGHVAVCFRHYTAAQRGQYCAVRSKITSAIIRDMDERFKVHSHAFDPIEVHPSTIEMALEYVREPH